MSHKCGSPEDIRNEVINRMLHATNKASYMSNQLNSVVNKIDEDKSMYFFMRERSDYIIRFNSTDYHS